MNSNEYINYQLAVKEVIEKIAKLFKDKNPNYQDESLLASIIDSLHHEGKKLSDIKSGIYDSLIVTRYQEFKTLNVRKRR